MRRATDTKDVGVGKEGSLTFATAWAGLGQSGAIKSTFTGDDLKNAWSAGKLAYWITGPWNKTVVEQSGQPFVAEPVPGWEGVSTPRCRSWVLQGFYMNQNSKNKSTAQSFLDATMNTDFMNSLFKADPRPPAWVPSQAQVANDPVLKAVMDYGRAGSRTCRTRRCPWSTPSWAWLRRRFSTGPTRPRPWKPRAPTSTNRSTRNYEELARVRRSEIRRGESCREGAQVGPPSRAARCPPGWSN